jgi:hypothetical protein
MLAALVKATRAQILARVSVGQDVAATGTSLSRLSSRLLGLQLTNLYLFIRIATLLHQSHHSPPHYSAPCVLDPYHSPSQAPMLELMVQPARSR